MAFPRSAVDDDGSADTTRLCGLMIGFDLSQAKLSHAVTNKRKHTTRQIFVAADGNAQTLHFVTPVPDIIQHVK